MDGILLLGPANDTGSFNAVDPNFVLMAWDAGKIPTNNWTDGEYWGNGGPGLTRWFSTDVKLLLSRFVEIWQPSTSTTRPYDLGWGVDSKPLGNGTNEFAINGTFSGVSYGSLNRRYGTYIVLDIHHLRRTRQFRRQLDEDNYISLQQQNYCRRPQYATLDILGRYPGLADNAEHDLRGHVFRQDGFYHMGRQLLGRFQ
jgi:hypothetical protein